MSAQQFTLFSGAVAALHAERIACRTLHHIGAGRGGGLTAMHHAVLAHPVSADTDLQRFIGADQAQRGEQVVAIDRTDRAAITFTGPIHQQRMARGHGVAIHQP
ncbi:hypothetical protein D3C71_1647330 [compost metagenome]